MVTLFGTTMGGEAVQFFDWPFSDSLPCVAPLIQPDMNEHQKGAQPSHSRFCGDTSIYVGGEKTEIMTDKVCLVTGSGRRIGASIIRKFAAEGYAFLIHVSRSVEAGELLKSELID